MDMKAKSVQDLLLYLMMIKQSFCHFGTNSFTQLLLESSEIACKSQTEVNIGGKVATYFTEIYEQLKAEGIINCVTNLIKIYADYELWVTGHSLGGALASLAAAEIASSGLINAQNIKLLTLGQPRTGNWDWAAAMDQILPYYNYRVVNHRDVIVHLPMRFFEGYHHYSTEVHFLSLLRHGLSRLSVSDIVVKSTSFFSVCFEYLIFNLEFSAYFINVLSES
uniref:Fungal lipase-type domain-containing protein n=1 Tax=Meloidogyne enterolobii TaxID=390850 RepID=A0A6V7Y510_MELEN|nr:unnamed protein product [Meloidogyne enterolobii]